MTQTETESERSHRALLEGPWTVPSISVISGKYWQSSGDLSSAVPMDDWNAVFSRVLDFLATFTSGNVSSPKSSQSRSKTVSDSYEITSNQHRRSSKENLSKSFIIRRRPLTTDQESNLIQSQVFKYKQPSSLDHYPQYRQDTYDVDEDHDDEEEDDDEDDDDDDTSTSDKERQTKDLSATISNIRPSAYYSSATQVWPLVSLLSREMIHFLLRIWIISIFKHSSYKWNRSWSNWSRKSSMSPNTAFDREREIHF